MSWIILYALLGLLTFIVVTYHDYRDGNDIKLGMAAKGIARLYSFMTPNALYTFCGFSRSERKEEMKKLSWILLVAVAVLVGCGSSHTYVERRIEGPTGERGLPGANGQDGVSPTPAPYEVLAIVDPCGDAPGIYDEVLLRLANGQVLGSFSDNTSGMNTRFALIPPGTYQTTDGSSCTFTINADGSIL